MPKQINLTAEDIEKAAAKLVNKLKKYNLKKDKTLVVAVGRGGFIPAQYIAYGLGIRDIACIQSKLYEDKIMDTTQMEVSGALMLDYDTYETLIVVDDLIDTGTTMEVLIEVLENMAIEMDTHVSIIPAVLYTQKSKKETKGMKVVAAKSFYKKGEPSKWLNFPWNTFVEGADS